MLKGRRTAIVYKVRMYTLHRDRGREDQRTGGVVNGPKDVGGSIGTTYYVHYEVLRSEEAPSSTKIPCWLDGTLPEGLIVPSQFDCTDHFAWRFCASHYSLLR